MFRASETAINLCNHFSCTEISEYQNLFESGRQNVLGMDLPSPVRVYLGAEFCEQRLSEPTFKGMIRASEHFKAQNILVTFCIPPLSQSNFKRILDNMSAASSFIDEVVVNDFGTLHVIKNFLWSQGKTIVAGRLFDKSIREARFNIFSLAEIKNNAMLVLSSNLTESHFLNIFQKYGVHRFETDTLPDGILEINRDLPLAISVHYPRIYLSSARYCEFASIGLPANRKFKLPSICGYQCVNQWQEINVEGRKVVKLGNCIFYNQVDPVHLVVDAKCRIVYSTCY